MENQIISRKADILGRLESILYDGNVIRGQKEIDRLKVAYEKAQQENMLAQGSLVSIKDEIDDKYGKVVEKIDIKRENILLREKNEKQFLYGSRQEVINDLKQLSGNTEHIGKSYEQIKVIQDRWKAVGRVKSEDEREVELQNQYNHLIEVFYHNIEINKELRDLDYKLNLEKKQEILQRFAGLESITDVRELNRKMRSIQSDWRAAGPVPYEKKDEINGGYNDLADGVYSKINAYYDGRKGELDEKLKEKIALCEKVNGLNTEDLKSPKEWGSLTDQVVQIQKDWKEIGFSSENETIWNVFRNSCDTFFEKKRGYFQNLDQQRIENTKRKIELCDQAEKFSTSTEWNPTTQKFLGLQKSWKEVGPAMRGEEAKLWNRFRSACDVFFNAKRTHFTAQNVGYEENLAIKEEIIKNIESMELSEEPDQDFLKLKQFSAKWNDTGYVPFDRKDELIQQYRAAMEAKYKALNINEGERKNLEYQNRLNKLMDSDNPNAVITQERRKLSDKIDRTRDELTRYENNLGFFGEGAEDNPLFKDVNRRVTSLRAELSDLSAKRRQMDLTIEKNNEEAEKAKAAKEAENKEPVAAEEEEEN